MSAGGITNGNGRVVLTWGQFTWIISVIVIAVSLHWRVKILEGAMAAVAETQNTILDELRDLDVHVRPGTRQKRRGSR